MVDSDTVNEGQEKMSLTARKGFVLIYETWSKQI